MTPHDWYVEHRAAWVAGALEPKEERLFADHLRRCEECRSEIAEMERDLSWLPMGATPAVPRPGLTHEIADRVLRRRSAWRRYVPALAAAAAIAVAVGLGMTEHRRRTEVETLLADRDHRLAALEDTLSVMRSAVRVVQHDISMDGYRGGLLIFQDETSHRWNVVVHGLPAAPAGSVYQFWFVTESGMVKSVELPISGSRPAFATVSMPPKATTIMGAALTVEPMLASSDQPKGPEIAHVNF
ncbi:MAG TPA: anti-sigma factor [Gemmatimonadales bacterium]|jgi:anti-sigma-K factor RskA|nr:anti-sigma factor [Gemmatimonadales bacterium]